MKRLKSVICLLLACLLLVQFLDNLFGVFAGHDWRIRIALSLWNGSLLFFAFANLKNWWRD